MLLTSCRYQRPHPTLIFQPNPIKSNTCIQITQLMLPSPPTRFPPSFTFARQPKPNNRLLISRPLAIPTKIPNRLLHHILIVANDTQACRPLTTPFLRKLIQDIFLRVIISTAEILHQVFDVRVHWNIKLHVGRVVVSVNCALPRLFDGLEDVDLAVFFREEVVIAGFETDTTSVVAQVDAREAVVGERGSSRICHSSHAETSVWRYHHGLLHDRLLHHWLCHRKRSWPTEIHTTTEEIGILRHTCWLGGKETWWCWSGIEAMESVVSCSGHHIWSLKRKTLRGRCGWWWWAWISSVNGIPAVLSRCQCSELLEVCDAPSEDRIHCY
jgi:hypothetical protein